MGILDRFKQNTEAPHQHQWERTYDQSQRFDVEWTVTSRCECGATGIHKEWTPLAQTGMAALGMIMHTTWIDSENPHLVDMMEFARRIQGHE